MATIKLPVRVAPLAYSMRVEMDSLLYDLTFRFNARDDHWFMDLAFDDLPVVQGMKVVHSSDLLSQFAEFQVDGRLPPGQFIVLDVTGAGRDPDKTTFGDDVVMLYTEAL